MFRSLAVTLIALMIMGALAKPVQADTTPVSGTLTGTTTLTATANPAVFDTNFTGSGVDSVSGPFTTTNMGTLTFSSPTTFTTSLTKSASSRVFNSFFIPFAHTPTVVQSRFFSGRCAAILGLFFPVQPTGSVRVTSSSRCCPPDISPITCDHDDVFELPDGSREAGSPFS